jgi:hypothetical protein
VPSWARDRVLQVSGLLRRDAAWLRVQRERQLRDAAAALETELPRHPQPETAQSEPGEDASAEHLACPLQALVGEVEQASEAEALAQRISRRWFRRNPQSSRSGGYRISPRGARCPITTTQQSTFLRAQRSRHLARYPLPAGSPLHDRWSAPSRAHAGTGVRHPKDRLRARSLHVATKSRQ